MVDLNQILADKIKNKSNQLNRASMGLIEWGRKYVPHYFTLEFANFHTQLANVLNTLPHKRAQKIALVVPRGYAKSTFASFLMVLKAVCECTDRYILIGSDTEGQAAKYLASIKAELEGNEALKELYPTACGIGGTWNTERIETKNGVCVEVFGKGTGVRGRKYGPYRPTLIVLDDPQNDEDVNSPTKRLNDIEWMNRSLIPCGDTNTNYLLISNDIHQESIIHTFSLKPNWNCLKWVAIEKWPTRMDLWDEWELKYYSSHDDESKKATNQFYIEHKAEMEAGAQVLWPQKESLYDLMVMRASLGHAAFEAEKQNNPRDPKRSEFPEEWFEKVDKEYSYEHLPVDKPLISIGYSDPAKGVEKRQRDDTATISLHFDPKQYCCYIEADIRKLPATHLTDYILDLHSVINYVAFGIETNGFQYLLGEELFEKAKQRGRMVQFVPVDHYGVKKERRISRLGIWLERGFFRFKKNCPYTKILIKQLKDHPFNDHDDGADGLEAALRILTSVCNLDNTGEIAVPGDDNLGDNLCDLLE